MCVELGDYKLDISLVLHLATQYTQLKSDVVPETGSCFKHIITILDVPIQYILVLVCKLLSVKLTIFFTTFTEFLRDTVDILWT